jgi:hypothetical protein
MYLEKLKPRLARLIFCHASEGWRRDPDWTRPSAAPCQDWIPASAGMTDAKIA